MADSTHRVEVVPVLLEPHPNADSLSLVRVWGYTCVVNTEQWEGKALGAYIPPDSVVPETEDFAFLGSHRRIKCRRFRGVMSMGLLHPAPDGAQIGDDVASVLGITHYEPPLRNVGTGGEAIAGPPGLVSYRYDVEAWRRYGADVMVDGETVMVTEKIHGANARFVYSAVNDVMYCGSRSEWKRQDASNLWWRALALTPAVEAWCRAHPGDVLYGEVYGHVQDLRYGHGPGGVAFAAFDILRGGVWVDAWTARHELESAGVPLVPLLYRGPYHAPLVEGLADGPSVVPGANHVREGVVVKPEVERAHAACGRVALKIVSAAYLERAA